MLSKLKQLNFDQQVFSNETTCAICMSDFKETDKITPLPCDEKHYFHSECIIDWLSRNNSCPFCKKEIKSEDLDKQGTPRAREATPENP